MPDTPEMVEKVARAICKSRTCTGASCCQWPAQAGRRHDCPVDKGYFDEAARAAIAAMREPSTAMLDAGEKAPRTGMRRMTLWNSWQAMIDEALGTK